MLTDYEQMLVSALRYALGRRTYIVGITVDFIISELHSISDYCKDAMIRDIETAHSYGDECDKEDWMRLLKEMNSKWLKPKDYHGCRNCIHQPEQFQVCGWLKIQKSVTVVCPNWEKKGDEE